MNEQMNLENILRDVIGYMEFVEKNKPLGSNKKKLVISLIKTNLGSVYKNYEEEIETMIELVIFISKLDKKLNINKKVKRSILDCISSC
tara:strand:- start:476 stop:742 length:267 start_codon:yes stop_codon:yes gene_type:complete